MRVLVACEFSGIVRDAFRARGHDAWSCDIVPTERPGPHIVNDVRNVLDWDWDLLIAHPPCKYLSYAGARWFKSDPDRWRKAREAFKFAMTLWTAPIPMIAMENGRGYIRKWYRMPDQTVEPFWFGHPMTKATDLWLKQLPPLFATIICSDPEINWVRNGKFSHSEADRARTFPGFAVAMAAQWG